MANRIPLIVNSDAKQIQELPNGDSLNGIVNITATGTITANEFVGAGIVPVGGIIMWSGAISAIPTNFKLCNGNNGTPDLRNKFIVGATSDGSDTTYPGLQPGATGGDAAATLVSHSHTTNSIIEPGSNTAKNLTGRISIDSFISTQGNFNNIVTGLEDNFIVNSGDDAPAGATNQAEYNGNHRHGTDTQGVSATNKNLPPYYALAYIMRTT